MTELEQLVAELKQDYHAVRVLEDGTLIGIGDLLFTRAIYVDIDRYGYGRRFCYEDREMADKEFAALKSGDDEPKGWIAKR